MRANDSCYKYPPHAARLPSGLDVFCVSPFTRMGVRPANTRKGSDADTGGWAMIEHREAILYLEKAIESLAGAQNEYDSGRYNNSANRA